MTENNTPSGVVSKSQILEMYGISTTTLQRLLNIRYYNQLAEIGYEKNARLLSPKQFELFKSLYGEP